ncbi:N-acetylmuramoyl-L-alanine amidase [Rhabdaerophilum sp.]|uniref:peptidoglycan recognition protein family protein n=1 Tax=Rhabdaerophilum sp. TaxID=2717341 RepID=UPI0038D46E89
MTDMPPEPKPDIPHVTRLFPSPNHGARMGGRGGEPRAPDSIILHYTGMADASSALLWLCNPVAEVSAHYFVFEDGRIFQLVPESRRAWHAGRGSWRGETDMNSASIGIEIAHPGHDPGRGFGANGHPLPLPEGVKPNPYPPPGPPFPERQIEAVIRLVGDIKSRWTIPDSRILAHSDIAPGRKIDPGENFPWEKLAAAGLGLWPTISSPAGGPTYRRGDEGMPVAALQSLFANFGYGLEISGVFDERMEAVVAAFQRHWRPGRVDGVADGETLQRLRALAGMA